MDAKTPLPPRPSRTQQQPVQDKPRRTYDKLLEHSFYIGALALVAVMEWYAQLTGTPRMPWAYSALVLIAIAYAVRRIRPFKAWRARRRMARRLRNSARANDGDEPGAVRVSRRASGT
jgi:hypothetical protein